MLRISEDPLIVGSAVGQASNHSGDKIVGKVPPGACDATHGTFTSYAEALWLNCRMVGTPFLLLSKEFETLDVDKHGIPQRV